MKIAHSIVKYVPILLIPVLTAGSLLPGFSYTSGSPDGCTGSPADKATCAQKECHNGKAVFKPDMITSTVGSQGYVPGSTYSFVATVQGIATSRKFGFQVSPQTATGKLMGKMSLINASETKLTGKGKYINQKDLGVDGKGSRSWSFKWTAPAKGSGPVTFYGCFLVGGKTELIYNTTLTINEAK